jgi:autotransporter-associated beta strand protein
MLAISGLSIMGTATVLAQDNFSFTNGGGDNWWSNTANWSGGTGVPDAGDNIITPTSFLNLYVGNPSIAAPNFEVNNFTFNGTSDWALLGVEDAAGTTLTINGTLTHAGLARLLFRNSGASSDPLSLDINHVEVNGTTAVRFGERGGTTERLEDLTIGTMNINGGAVLMNVGLNNGVASVTGNLNMSGSSTLWAAMSPGPVPTHILEVGSLTSTNTAPIIAANDYNGTTTHAIIDLKTNGTASYAGRLIDTTGTSVPTSLAVEMNGTGTQILTGNTNTYDGGTTVNSGTLLINNTSGSGTGTGAVNVVGGTFGGTGLATGVVVVDGGATLMGGDGGGATDGLSLSGDVTLSDNSIISLSLGTAGTHSTLERTGGLWAFDLDQEFSFVDFGIETGDYLGIITGLTGSETGLSSIATWSVLNPEWLGTFTLDGANVNLSVAAVPEPTSGVLVIIGLAMLLALRKRHIPRWSEI